MKTTGKNRYFSYVLMYGAYYFATAMFGAIISIYLIGIGLSAVRISLLISISSYIFFSVFIIAAAFGVLMIRTGEEKTDSAARKDVSRNYKREVLKNGNFIKYLIITAAFYCTMSLNAVYLPALYQSEGVAVTTVTTIMFISTMMEIPVIFFAARFMEKLHNMQLMTVSFSIAFLQFLLYVLIPVPAVQAVVTMLCRSTSTMIYIMINMKVIADIVPPAYQMSALTLVTALSGSSRLPFTVR